MSEHVEISKRLVLINSISAIVRHALALTVLVWLQQYLIKRIPAAEYAIYGVIQSLILFVPLLSIVISGGLSRFVVERYAKGDYRGVTQVISTTAPFSFAIALFVLIVGSVLALELEHVLTIKAQFVFDAKVMFLILVVISALRIAVMPFTVGLGARQKFVLTHVIGLCGQVIFMAVLASLLFGVNTRAMWVVVAVIPQTLFELSVTVWLSRRAMPCATLRRGEFRRELIRPLLSFGGWTMLARCMALARSLGNPIILNELPLSRLAHARVIESAGYRLGGLVESRVYPTALVPLSTTMPALTAMYATGQEDRLRRAYFSMTRIVLWSYLFFAVPIIIYHAEFWSLYDDQNKYPAAGLVTVMLMAKAVVVFNQPVMAQLVAVRADTRPMALRVVLQETLITSGMLYAILVHDAGAVGAATVSFAITMVLHPPLFWTLGLKLANAKFSEWFRATLVPGYIPALVATPALLGLRVLHVPNDWWTLLAHGAFGCAVYVGTLVLFCLSPTERADLAKIKAKARSFLPPPIP